MALYAAYGSNLDPTTMAGRAPASPPRGPGWLVGWRLTFGGEDLGWDGSLVTVVEEPGFNAELSQVYVMLYDVHPDDEASLDQWDGAALGVYRKLHVRVHTLDGEQLAWLYVLDAYEGGLPSAHHLSVVTEAAASAGAPADYIADLANRPCRPAAPPGNSPPAV
jgi:hypothetical protein